MHQGAFPDPHSPRCTPEPYAPGRWRPEDLDPDAPPRRSRRDWLLAAAGLLAGLCASPWLPWPRGGAAAGRESNAAPAAAGRTAPRGTLEWALGATAWPAAELLAAAGDLERVATRYRSECHLVAVFERLLDVALQSQAEEAGMAGACALRSLGRLGRADLVREVEPRVAERTDFPQLMTELRRQLQLAAQPGRPRSGR